MNDVLIQILYGCVFVSVLLACESAYLIVKGATARNRAANRRMKAIKERGGDLAEPTVIQRQIGSDPISQRIVEVLPAIERSLSIVNIALSPALCAVGIWVFSITIMAILELSTPMPISMTIASALVIGVGGPIAILRIAIEREYKKFSDQIPDAINLVTRGLQAGYPVPVALRLVAEEMPDPIGSQFGIALDEIQYGRDRGEALRDIGLRFPNADFRFFLAALQMQRETGGNLVSILDNLTDVIRDREGLRKKAWAMSAEGRLTAMLVGILPYLLLVFLFVTSPEFLTAAMPNPMFMPLMVGAFILWTVGMVIIWRMVNIKV